MKDVLDHMTKAGIHIDFFVTLYSPSTNSDNFDLDNGNGFDIVKRRFFQNDIDEAEMNARNEECREYLKFQTF